MGTRENRGRVFLAPFRGVRSLERFLACGKGRDWTWDKLTLVSEFLEAFVVLPIPFAPRGPGSDLVEAPRSEARLARIRRNGALEF
jgi:hypothetical protein